MLESRDTERMMDMAEKVRAGTHKYFLLPPGAIRRDDGVWNPILEVVL